MTKSLRVSKLWSSSIQVSLNNNSSRLQKLIFHFFSDAKGLTEPSRVRNIRHQILKNMEDYISDKLYDSRGRFGEILLLLPVVQSITWQMIQQIEVAKMIGVAHIDNLLQEMLLGGETPPMDTTPMAFSPTSNGNASAGENEGSVNGNGNTPENDPGHLEPSLANVNLLQSSPSDSQLQSLGDSFKQKDNNQNFLSENSMDMYQQPQHQSHVSPRVQPYDLNIAHQQAHHHHLRSTNSHLNQYNGNTGRKVSPPYKTVNIMNNHNPMYDGMVTSSSGNDMMVLKEEPENGY
jgi:hepatocyte nuclear factor 4